MSNKELIKLKLDELLSRGEAINIEFKEKLPEKSFKYMKSIVAFANGIGGKIIFGISDNHNVIGLEKDSIFKIMDTITNAISDSCEPPIIPDISFKTIDNKTIIIVEIEAGRQRPYYIKSLGIENGVFIRVAGTTRLADAYMIKELMFEGSNRCYDQSIYLGLDISEEDVDRLCQSLKQTALNNAKSDEEKRNIKDVTKQQLLAWGVLAEKDGKLLPTNAYTILTGTGDANYSIQCGLFKGNTKAIFIDKREFYGPIQDQIEQAYQFVLRNIHLGIKIEGVYRKDIYEIPPASIRELIINGAVHRSYLDHGNIQVAIYDDRLEITTPGKLPMGQTIERMKQGYSKVRNEALANAFSYMNLIEHWDSGIPRIIQSVKELGLREPEIIGGDMDLRVNIYRNTQTVNVDGTNLGTNGTNLGTNGTNLNLSDIEQVQLSDVELKIISLIERNPTITQKEYSELSEIPLRTIKRIFSDLQVKGKIKREGSNRKGKWIILK